MDYIKVLDKIWEEGASGCDNITDFYKEGRLMLKVAELNGIHLSEEQLRFIMYTHPKILCMAGAGSGKTTTMQLKTLRLEAFKGIPRDKILNLVYNVHATKDVKNRNTKLCNGASIGVNSDITVSTFHAFAKEWVDEYKSELGFFKLDVMEQSMAVQVAKRVFKEMKDKKIDVVADKFIAWYAKIREELKHTKDMEETWLEDKQFLYFEISPKVMRQKIDMFENYKRRKFLQDFTGYTLLLRELATNNKDFLVRFRRNYKVIAADEYQDFSNLMDDIILKLDVDYRFLVGDYRQAIYEFRGANPYKRFEESYGGVSLYLNENRRCPQKIVDVSNNILKLQKYQDVQMGVAIRDGGEVRCKGYSNRQEEYKILKDILLKLDPKESTVITFRNREQSYLMTTKMVRENIPFRMSNANNPFTDIFSRSVEGIINLLRFPHNPNFIKESLWKMLPTLTKAVTHELVKDFPDYSDVKFWDIKFPVEVKSASTFHDQLECLKQMSNIVRKGISLSKMWKLFYKQFYKHYWRYVGENFDKDLEAEVSYFFAQDISIDTLYEQLDLYEKRMKEYEQMDCPVFTTFHGLKGLEFDNVIVIDLNQNIIPNRDFLDGDTDAQLELESSNRLMYVVVTRSKNRLYTLYDINNKSFYVDVINSYYITDSANMSDEFSLLNKMANDISLEKNGVLDDLSELDSFTDSSLDAVTITTTENQLIDENIVLNDTSDLDNLF